MKKCTTQEETCTLVNYFRVDGSPTKVAVTSLIRGMTMVVSTPRLLRYASSMYLEICKKLNFDSTTKEIMMSNYVESIERFTESVNTDAIDNLVKHLGIALRSADGSTVAASDPDELKTIQNGFCAKKLGMTADEASKAIEEVCEIMKHDSAKCRVTFYYLLADRAGKISEFA